MGVIVFDKPSERILVSPAGEKEFLVLTGGAPGTRGPAGPQAQPFEYQMPVAQTTAVIDHTLERDPVSVQVFDESGRICSEYSVVFTDPAKQVRVGFDVAVKALIRMI